MPLLEVDQVSKHFRIGAPWFGSGKGCVRAVDSVSFTLAVGETLAIVGESGSGKSTLGRLILNLDQPSSGAIRFKGQRWSELDARGRRAQRRSVQAVFQDPFSSLSPRMRIGELVAEPMINFGLVSDKASARQRVATLLQQVGLAPDAAACLPHEFSGGQRQRIAIARAIAASPELIVCDEAVSALDVSIKAQIVNLLRDLQSELELSLIFISHDLAIVENIARRVAVMYAGRLVEVGDRRTLFSTPAHPYTQALLASVPSISPFEPPRGVPIRGDAPDPLDFPQGCRFHPRCPHTFDRCRSEEPRLTRRSVSHQVACHLAEATNVPEVLVEPAARRVREEDRRPRFAGAATE